MDPKELQYEYGDDENMSSGQVFNFKDLGLSIVNIKDANISFSSVNLKNHYTT